MPGEQRMVLRETGLGAERLLVDRAVEALGERDDATPALVAVGPGAGHERGVLARVQHSASASTAIGSAACERSSSAGPSTSCGSGAGADQSSIGTITSAGPRCVTAAW